MRCDTPDMKMALLVASELLTAEGRPHNTADTGDDTQHLAMDWTWKPESKASAASVSARWATRSIF